MKIINILKAAAVSALFVISFTASANNTSQVDEEVYSMVEERPTVNIDGKEYQQADFMSLMMNQKAPEGCTPGRIICKMIIGSDGSVKEVKVMKGLDEATDAAAVKLLETTGKWSPGKHRGKPVAVSVTIPVVFR